MRAVSAVSVLGVATATSFIAVDRSCPDASTGCNGGCYQWEDDEDFFGNCMVGKAPPVAAIMEDFVIVSVVDGVEDCAMRGFVPLKQLPGGGNSAPDGCYGGAGTRVSFFASEETWFWPTVFEGGANPPVDCALWVAENPQCFDAVGEPSDAIGGGGFGCQSVTTTFPGFDCPLAAATSFIAVDRSCPDPSTGCNGGCYQWEDDANFYGNCMHGKSPAADIIIPDPVIVVGGDCAELGFTPLTQAPYGTPIPGGSSAPDRCYGEDYTRVSFFVTDQKWAWDDAVTGFTPNGFDPVPACKTWQAENPQCFGQVVALV